VAPAAPQPALPNWLLGEWQGPTQGCPPNGGVTFEGSKATVFSKGKVDATFPVAYRVEPGSVTVSTVGPDGIAQDFVYQKTGANSMIIVGIPPNMSRALLGAAHRRCGVAKTEQAQMMGPAAVYPDSTPDVSDNQPTPKESAKSYADAQAIAGAPAAAQTIAELPKTTKSAAEPEPAPAPMPEPEAATPKNEPIIPELKPEESTPTQTAEAPTPAPAVAPVPETPAAAAPAPAEPTTAETNRAEAAPEPTAEAAPEPTAEAAAEPAAEAPAEPTAPALPKSTTPASVEDKAKKAEEEKAAAEAAAKAAAEPAPASEPTTPEPEATSNPEPQATSKSEPQATSKSEPQATTNPEPEATTSTESAPPAESTAEATPAPEPAPAEPSAEPTVTEPTATEPTTPAPTPTQEAAVTSPSPALAATQQELAEEALASGNVDKALSIWEPLAKSGDTGVAVNVAGMYEFGSKPMPQDYAKAAEWYMMAAEHGDPYAQYKMGRAYTRGTGVPIDRVQAYKWLTIAMQSLSNAKEGQTGKASRMEIETGLNDIVGAMSQEEVTKASQMVRQYNEQHHIAE
jgi:hypothetical protein